MENYDKLGIRGLPRGFWVGRWDQFGWANRLMQQCPYERVLHAALSGQLNDVPTERHPVFGVAVK